MTEQPEDTLQSFEQIISNNGQGTYLLRLYVTGTTPKSVNAISNIKQICEKHLKGRFELEVIDIYQKPHMAKQDQIIALPTLIKKLPMPLRRIIGDLSDSERVLMSLDLIEK